jgi:DnaJ-domain-containing protein 1
MMAMVEEVIKLLMEGVDPQQLLQQGVPQEVIEMAIAELQKMQAQQGGQPQVAQGPQQGLAATPM